MRALFQFLIFIAFILLGGIVLIKYAYKCSWRESFEIADQFIADLLGGQ